MISCGLRAWERLADEEDDDGLRGVAGGFGGSSEVEGSAEATGFGIRPGGAASSTAHVLLNGAVSWVLGHRHAVSYSSSPKPGYHGSLAGCWRGGHAARAGRAAGAARCSGTGSESRW